MEKKIIRMDGDRLDLPLSVAVQYGSLLFVSGNVSQSLETREPLLGTVEAETERILLNIEAILKKAGSSLDRVLKVQAFLADIADFEAFNSVYVRFFPKDPPARSTFGIKLAGPYKLEIEAIAYVPDRG